MERIFAVTGTTMTIVLPPEIDHHTSERIRKEADYLAQRRCIRTILFDFSEVTFMDSSGIGMIIGRYKLMKFLGGSVALIQVSPRMEKILKLSGIDKIIDMDRERQKSSMGGGAE